MLQATCVQRTLRHAGGRRARIEAQTTNNCQNRLAPWAPGGVQLSSFARVACPRTA
jgi:hypothetical protein